MKDRDLRIEIPTTFDNTMLATWATCPRRLYWFLRGLDYKERPAYFTWGTAFGAAVNAWHASVGQPKRDRVLSSMVEIDRYWIDSPLAIDLNSKDNLLNCFLGYTEVYGEEEPWTILYEGKELGFTLPIPGTEFFYAGAIDGGISWPGFGNLVLENKTTGQYITEGYSAQYEHSTQITGYFWAFAEIVGEPFGVYVNSTSKRKRKEKDLQYHRQLTKRGKYETEYFLRDTKALIEDILREYDQWKWPKYGQRNPMNCAGGAGRSPCLYRRLCTMEFEPWDLDEEGYDFSSEFGTREKWEPWNRGKEVEE